jgi:hypothetical protein
VNYEDKDSDRKIAIDVKVKTVMEVKERNKLIVMMQAMKMAVML